jgi:DNA-binding PadR family transcriptional regulator
MKELMPLTEAFYYILIVLCKEPAHGYAIMQETERMSGGRVKIGPGTLYTALSTLTKKSLIENLPGQDEDSRRKLYAITAQGRSTVEAEMERLSEMLENGRRLLSGGEG